MVQDFPSDSIVVTMTFRWTPDLLSLPHQWSPMSINYDVDNNCSGAVVYLCGVYYNSMITLLSRPQTGSTVAAPAGQEHGQLLTLKFHIITTIDIDHYIYLICPIYIDTGGLLSLSARQGQF